MSTGKCTFDEAWRGRCGCAATAGGYCEKHAAKACSVCKKQATRECDHTGQFVCGAPLCDDCEGHTDTAKEAGSWGFMNHTHRAKVAAQPPAPPAEEEGGNGWMPIATAPRDGTLIDLWHKDGRRCADASWGLPPHECGEFGRYCDSDWHDFTPGWVVDYFDAPNPSEDFTHWRRLPAAPGAAAAAPADLAPGLVAAADLLQEAADLYMVEHTEADPDTGDTIWHYREAGRDHHSNLTEWAEKLRSHAARAAQAQGGAA